jgi:mannose-6-phosphate isomerase-like protein (cupin superfamily)
MAYIGQVIDNRVTGERIVFLRTAASTGGRLLAFGLTLTPNGHVPASHVHPALEERFNVIEGRMRFRRGLRTIVAKEGDTVTVPAGTIHRFANAGGGVARAMVEVRPAYRMEELLETTAELANQGRTLPNGMPAPLEMALFMREFDEELRIPLVPHFLVKAALSPVVWIARRLGLELRDAPADRLAA